MATQERQNKPNNRKKDEAIRITTNKFEVQSSVRILPKKNRLKRKISFVFTHFMKKNPIYLSHKPSFDRNNRYISTGYVYSLAVYQYSIFHTMMQSCVKCILLQLLPSLARIIKYFCTNGQLAVCVHVPNVSESRRPGLKETIIIHRGT